MLNSSGIKNDQQQQQHKHDLKLRINKKKKTNANCLINTYIAVERQPMMMASFCYRLDRIEALIMTTLE